MLFKINQREQKSNKMKSNIRDQTRASNKVFYTKAMKKNFDPGKAAEESVALRGEFF